MSLTLFFLAVGYSNNLIYLFVFFLISVAITGMIITNKNIANLKVESVTAANLFCHEGGWVHVDIRNPAAVGSWDIYAKLEKTKGSEAEKIHVASAGHATLKISYRPRRRGNVHLPRIALQSSFPFGLLRAWKYAFSEQAIIVFPERRGDLNFPVGASDGQNLQQAGLFRDHRAYQSADLRSRIDWRASARRDELLVKNYEEPEKPKLTFSWESTEHLADIESRLAQLSLWIDEAERRGHQYSLKIPGVTTDPGRGLAHRDRCLTALALYEWDLS